MDRANGNKLQAATGNLYFSHIEIFFASAAFRTDPVACSLRLCSVGSNALRGRTRSIVINPTANQTYPSFRRCHSLIGLHVECNDCIQSSPPIAVSTPPLPRRRIYDTNSYRYTAHIFDSSGRNAVRFAAPAPHRLTRRPLAVFTPLIAHDYPC